MIEADLAAAGKANFCDGTPSLFVNFRALNVLCGERGHLDAQIAADEIEFVDTIRKGGWNAASAGGRAKISQPRPASTDLKPRASLKNARSASASLLEIIM